MSIRPLLILPASILLGASLYASSYSLSVSADTTKFDYTETANGAVLDTETNGFGDISGYTVDFQPEKNGFYVSGSYAKGDTDYIGGTNLNPTYGSHQTTTHNTLVDYSAGYKTTTVIASRHMEIPVKFGVGYHGWLRELQSTPTVFGYDEKYEWGYFDAGVGLHYRASSAILMGIDANYRKAFNAEMYENWNGYTYKLKNVYGYKVAVPLEYSLDASWSTFAKYTYEYWNIDASDPVGGYYEPDSETKNETLSVGVKFRF